MDESFIKSWIILIHKIHFFLNSFSEKNRPGKISAESPFLTFLLKTLHKSYVNCNKFYKHEILFMVMVQHVPEPWNISLKLSEHLCQLSTPLVSILVKSLWKDDSRKLVRRIFLKNFFFNFLSFGKVFNLRNTHINKYESTLSKTPIFVFLSNTSADFKTHNIKIRNVQNKVTLVYFENKVYLNNVSLFLLKKYIIITYFSVLSFLENDWLVHI